MKTLRRLLVLVPSKVRGKKARVLCKRQKPKRKELAEQTHEEGLTNLKYLRKYGM